MALALVVAHRKLCDVPDPVYACGEYHICGIRITRIASNSGTRVVHSPGHGKSKKQRTDEMRDFVDGTAFNFEQGSTRAQAVLAAWSSPHLIEAIADDKKPFFPSPPSPLMCIIYGNGPDPDRPLGAVARWSRGAVLCRDRPERSASSRGLMAFVAQGVRHVRGVEPNAKESERRHQAEAEAA